MIQMKMSDNGRVVIPADIRQKMGIKDGDIVYWDYSDGEARLTTLQARLRQAQSIVKRHVPPGVSLADELIAERRKEAAGE